MVSMPDLRAFRGQLLEIGLDLFIVGQLAVGADLESQKRLGRGLGGENERKEEKGEQRGCAEFQGISLQHEGLHARKDSFLSTTGAEESQQRCTERLCR